MTNNPKLLEPSFADAISAIRQADDLSDQHRRHWTCSLSQMAKWLDRPLTLIPARWTSVRMVVAQLRISTEDALALMRAHAFAHETTLDNIAHAVLRRELDFTINGNSDGTD